MSDPYGKNVNTELRTVNGSRLKFNQIAAIERLTGLLDRFVGHRTDEELMAEQILDKLQSSREQIVTLERSLAKIDTDLAALPSIREKLKRYKELGLDERLRDQKDLVSENSILESFETLVGNIERKKAQLEQYLPFDISRLDEEKIKHLGGASVLRTTLPVLRKFERDLRVSLDTVESAISTAKTDLECVRGEWRARQETVKAAHAKTLRELQKEGIDGGEYTDLLEKVEKLEPKKDQQTRLRTQLNASLQDRRKAVKEWEEFKASQFRSLERAAKKVSRKLANLVQVAVVAAGDRQPLENHVRSLGGRIADTVEILRNAEALSLSSLAAACREGKEELVRQYGLPAAQAERLAQSGTDFIARTEELELPATTSVRLNVAREGETPVWKKLDELSTGQKATAVLLLLLLDAKGPLVVDQPEDDLDNRFITEYIVPKVKEQKKRRQFAFATHNANIPVLGDAELIAALVPPVIVAGTEVHLPDENIGSIDSKKVCELVEETLEGGRDAFELRRLKYGF